jgi:hypothetical protein
LQRKGKRGSVVRGGREENAHMTGIAEENLKRNSRNTGSSEQRRRRVTFVLDFR